MRKLIRLDAALGLLYYYKFNECKRVEAKCRYLFVKCKKTERNKSRNVCVSSNIVAVVVPFAVST